MSDESGVVWLRQAVASCQGPAEPAPEADTAPLPEVTGDAARDDVALVVIGHPDRCSLGRQFHLGSGCQMQIGRSRAAEASFPDVVGMARIQARIRHLGSAVVIEAVPGARPPLLEGVPVTGRTELRSGDRVEVAGVHLKLLGRGDVEREFHTRVHELATRDALTSLHDRRRLEDAGRREVARARRYWRPLSLLLLDLDDFKLVNDRRGHVCGDRVLCAVARTLAGLVRAEQLLVRLGGEEFVALCPETPAAGASALARRLREAVADLLHEDGGDLFRVTCSVGVAQFVPPMTSLDDLLEGADRALYEAKRAGRDRVALHGA